jgi:hypothetical protein
MVIQNSDAWRREKADLNLAFIASEAKQSSGCEERMDCFAALAMTSSITERRGCLKFESVRRPGLEPGPRRRGVTLWHGG